MMTIESAFLRNANTLTPNSPTLRAELLRVMLSKLLSLQLIF